MKTQEYYTVRTAPNTLSNMVHGQAFRIITPIEKAYISALVTTLNSSVGLIKKSYKKRRNRCSYHTWPLIFMAWYRQFNKSGGVLWAPLLMK